MTITDGGVAQEPARSSMDQRSRLVAGLEEAIAEQGFARTTIGDIVSRARTSRRTFYAHFASREECLMALHAEAHDQQARHIADAVDESAPWQIQIRQAVAAWTEFADARPTTLMSWICDVPALAPLSDDLRRQTREQFVRVIQNLTSSGDFGLRAGGPASRTRALILLGGLERLATDTVESGCKMSSVCEEAVDASIALLGPGLPNNP